MAAWRGFGAPKANEQGGLPMSIRPRRSVLFMPGSNARAIEKARTLKADCVVLDLEDSVAPDGKEAARAQVMAAVDAGGFGAREVIVRINGLPAGGSRTSTPPPRPSRTRSCCRKYPIRPICKTLPSAWSTSAPITKFVSGR
jgi:hypothetical protein